MKLAIATSDFIQKIGFEVDDKGLPTNKPRVAKFTYSRIGAEGKPENMDLDVPMLAVVKVPSLSITRVDIKFNMEVKSSEAAVSNSSENKDLKVNAGYSGFGITASASFSGAVSSSSNNTRTSDNSAKYDIAILAEDTGIPEGLSRVLDMLHQAITPVSSTAAA